MLFSWETDIKLCPVPTSVLLPRKRFNMFTRLGRVFRIRPSLVTCSRCKSVHFYYFCARSPGLTSLVQMLWILIGLFEKWSTGVEIVIPFALFYCLQSLWEKNSQLIQEKEDLLHQMKQQMEKQEEEKVNKASLGFLLGVRQCSHYHSKCVVLPGT